MRTIVESPIGGDGAKVGVYIEDGFLVQKLMYPTDKALKPVTDLLDPLREKLKSIIPGDWDNPLIDGAFDAVKKELVQILTE